MMETYKLNSKLVENNNEYAIMTTNDVNMNSVQTNIFVNGSLTESYIMPHPDDYSHDDIVELIKTTHSEKKEEIEQLLNHVKNSLNSGSSDKMYNIGLVFYYKRFYAEARQLLQSAIKINPNCHQAMNILAQLEINAGNIKDAVRYAEGAVKIHPEFADYRNNLGEVYLASKKYREAMLEFERAFNINLYYSDAYFNSGLTLLLNAAENHNQEMFKDFITKAKEFLTKASLINPAYKTSLFERAVKALNEKDIKNAFNLFKNLRESIKENQHRKSARYYLNFVTNPEWVTEKTISDRIEFLKEEIQKNPTYLDLYAELSKCYLVYSKILWEKGIANYQKTIELNPSLSKLESTVNKSREVHRKISEVVSTLESKG